MLRLRHRNRLVSQGSRPWRRARPHALSQVKPRILIAATLGAALAAGITG